MRRRKPLGLLDQILKEASRDMFQDVGRIVLSDFTKQYDVSVNDVLRCFAANGIGFRKGGNVLLINGILKKRRKKMFWLLNHADRLSWEEFNKKLAEFLEICVL